MRLRLFLAFLCIQIITIKIVFGKDQNKTNSFFDNIKRYGLKDKYTNEYRYKRSLDNNENSFWPNEGEKPAILENNVRFQEGNNKNLNFVKDKESPFWGTRGRRGSITMESDIDSGPLLPENTMFYATNCDHCHKFHTKNHFDDNMKERREEKNIPFWGNRGRRSSEETDIGNYPVWESRDRRQEEDPFWGARGRREEEVPFWGNRGRRFSWGKNDEIVVKEPPFWGNRGRRNEIEPFWGSRGKRQEHNPFWGSRGKREKKSTQKEELKKVLKNYLNKVEDNMDSLTRTRRDDRYVSFWGSIDRDNKLSNTFQHGRQRYQIRSFLDRLKPTKSNTVHDDRIYADQPRFILVERSSRSSGEFDPFYISRGKKMVINYESPHSSRTRRGSLEELVKSVRNDPYYIARGKKFAPNNINENTSLSNKELEKAKELICATIDLILSNKGSKTKREVDDNDRDRRTILKKLAAQLQIDPYFVSRGKKNESFFNQDNLESFINEVSVKCN